MKKALSLLLALVMCLSLIPMTALAYGDNWIQMAKSNYDPNEEIVVTVSGTTAQMVDNNAFVGIFKKGASIGDYSESRWVEQGTNQYEMEGPTQSGDYEIRLYSKDYYYDDAALLSSVAFTVGKVAKDGTISLNKSAYTAFEQITVSVSGITAQMVNAKAFVALCEKGEKHSEVTVSYNVTQGSSTVQLYAPNKNGEFEVRLYSMMNVYTDETLVMSIPFTVSGATGSAWAQGELEKANSYGLIPDMLKGADFTKPITRREFAAVSVKLYENLTGKKATPAATNPFTDTNDAEVLKAYNVGLTAGTAADKFSPDVLLNREQAATMLTRVLKAAYIQGWTLPTDGNYTLNFTMPAKFADDAKISDWAKPSVYFMAANGIISGTGNNNFSPRATTNAEIAVNYASATREQALAIAVRMVDNLKDKPLDYKQDTATVPTQPTTPPSGSIDSKLVGAWKYKGSYSSNGLVYTSYSDYVFNANGTFELIDSASSNNKFTGKYSVSDGKVYFTDLRRFAKTLLSDEYKETTEDLENRNVIMEYNFASDNDGEYLRIAILGRWDEPNFEVPGDSSGIKFRKQ